MTCIPARRLLPLWLLLTALLALLILDIALHLAHNPPLITGNAI